MSRNQLKLLKLQTLGNSAILHQLQPCTHPAGKTCAISVKDLGHLICLFLCLSHLSFSSFFSLSLWSSFCSPSFYFSIFRHFPLPSLFSARVSALCSGWMRCSHRRFYTQIRSTQRAVWENLPGLGRYSWQLSPETPETPRDFSFYP